MLIHARQLTKRFGRTNAIDALDLEVEKGRPVGLVGPNGAGKTTLFSLIAGFMYPQRGSLSVLGHRPGDGALSGRVAVLPQDARFEPRQALHRQLRLLARLQGFSRRDAGREASRVLEALNILDLARRGPGTLSHGQQKRALIAQCLIGSPELVLLDEPTAGLDPGSVRAIRRLIQQAEAEATFLISSHNLDEIEDLCGSVAVLEKGRLVTQGDMDSLVQRGRKLSFRLARDATADQLAALDKIPGIEQVDAGAGGERLLVLHYREDSSDLEINILRALAETGLEFVEMSRGDSLSRRFSELTGN